MRVRNPPEEIHRKPRRRPGLARRRAPPASTVAAPAAVLAVVLAAVVANVSPARAAEGLWDSVLERMNVKAAPAAPGPDFVERSRPDPAGLGYLPTATPHKVSPLAVKTADQIQAEKDALDLAKARQLDPNAGRPAGPAKVAKAAAGPPAKPAKAPAPPRSPKAAGAAKPPAAGD